MFELAKAFRDFIAAQHNAQVFLDAAYFLKRVEAVYKFSCFLLSGFWLHLF